MYNVNVMKCLCRLAAFMGLVPHPNSNRIKPDIVISPYLLPLIILYQGSLISCGDEIIHAAPYQSLQIPQNPLR